MLSALNKRIRGSISFRIALLFSITFSFGLASAFLITYLEIGYSLAQNNREVISSKLRETSTLLKAEGLKGLQDFFAVEKNKINNARYLIRLVKVQGEVVYEKESVQEENFDFANTFNKENHPERFIGWHKIEAINDEDIFDILTEKIDSKYYLQIGKSSEDREEILSKILRVFSISGILLILLSAVLGVWYSRRALGPLRDLITTMHNIEAGDLSHRVALGETKDELHDLGTTFNRMVERIEKLIQVMKESLDNVAHDFRTPLTRIRAVAEDAILSEKPTDLKEALEECAESAVDLSELMDQLLSISEAEAGTMQLNLENCDVKLLLQDVADIYEFVAQEKNINLVINYSLSDPVWRLDRKRIKQVVGNLIDNAIKFSPNGSFIYVNASNYADKLEIAVVDQGIGVPTADLKRIWDRLFRSDKSRTSKGLGLGLSIVKSVIVAHGGIVDAEANSGGGMRFWFALPCKSNETP